MTGADKAASVREALYTTSKGSRRRAKAPRVGMVLFAALNDAFGRPGYHPLRLGGISSMGVLLRHSLEDDILTARLGVADQRRGPHRATLVDV
jgi:hypothetical protein